MNLLQRFPGESLNRGCMNCNVPGRRAAYKIGGINSTRPVLICEECLKSLGEEINDIISGNIEAGSGVKQIVPEQDISPPSNLMRSLSPNKKPKSKRSK